MFVPHEFLGYAFEYIHSICGKILRVSSSLLVWEAPRVAIHLLRGVLLTLKYLTTFPPRVGNIHGKTFIPQPACAILFYGSVALLTHAFSSFP